MKKLQPIEDFLVSTKVYESIRDAIISGKFPPGTKLTVDKLSAELDVSRTPVKEALVRLEREGLVENIPRRGMFVKKIKLEDAIEIYELREILESFAIRKVAESIDKETLDILTELLSKGEEYISERNLKKYSDIDERFHKILWDKSGNKRLAKILENIRSQIRLLMTSSVTVEGRAYHSLIEHKNIVSALEKKDPDLAERYMRIHVRNTKDIVLKVLINKRKEEI